MLVIPVGLWNPHLLGGSHDLIMYVTQMFSRGNWLSIAGLLGIFLVLRFAGTMIAYGSIVPSGIFMPIFVLGAIFRHPARHRNGWQYQSDFSDGPANLRCLLHQYAARGADVNL